MKRKILTYPAHIEELKRVSAHVEFGPPGQGATPEIVRVGVDLVDTLCSTENGVGLAAVQIGEPVRMIAVRVPGHEPVVLCNPTVRELAGEVVPLKEGCLSFPGVFEDVRRNTVALVNAYEVIGRPLLVDTRKETPFCGAEFMEQLYDPEELQLLAHALQHEIEHLDGVLFIDHLGYTARNRAKRRMRGGGV